VRVDSLNSALPALEAQEVTPATRQRIPNTTSLDWANSALPPLELGQEFDAVVLQLLPGDRVLLELGGRQIEADGPSGLNAGQQLRLRVGRVRSPGLGYGPCFLKEATRNQDIFLLNITDISQPSLKHPNARPLGSREKS